MHRTAPRSGETWELMMQGTNHKTAPSRKGYGSPTPVQLDQRFSVPLVHMLCSWPNVGSLPHPFLRTLGTHSPARGGEVTQEKCSRVSGLESRIGKVATEVGVRELQHADENLGKRRTNSSKSQGLQLVVEVPRIHIASVDSSRTTGSSALEVPSQNHTNCEEPPALSSIAGLCAAWILRIDGTAVLSCRMECAEMSDTYLQAPMTLMVPSYPSPLCAPHLGRRSPAQCVPCQRGDMRYERSRIGVNRLLVVGTRTHSCSRNRHRDRLRA
ncbi:hypothetical protein QBC35DRAFT_258655 [Podospora australis]|uniref:Uncharacterized protein n=1 Tax=Podospora australis TaxID=1536484 RepID=A0AAN6X2C8_9PEZI|nr:hypothetical protein QBC35DRAFT_258655 [Podospora australis]